MNCGFRSGLLLAAVAVVASAGPSNAQTDYYNTDAGRPILIEDAYPVERYAFELQIAPIRLERARGGVYSWGFEPEIAWGALPRTHIEVGFPLHVVDNPLGEKEAGLAGIELAVLHNLNVETETVPALGIAVEALLPAGGLAPGQVYPSVKGIVTRTYRFARFHVNGRYTFGDEPDITDHGATGELSRWLAGVAIDKTYPLHSALLTASVYAHQPLAAANDVVWHAEAGVRYQLDPRFALDFGVGRQLSGAERSQFLTFGVAYAFAIRALMPGQAAQ